MAAQSKAFSIPAFGGEWFTDATTQLKLDKLIEKENIDYDELTRMRDEHFKNKVPAAASA